MAPSLTARRRLFTLLLILSITVIAALTSTGVAYLKRPSPVVLMQNLNVKSDKYTGKVEFEDTEHNKFKGPGAELKVDDDRRFTLTYNGREYKGELVTLISGGKPGGHITFDGAQEISIVWIQRQAETSRLKIINANGSTIKFRFCSDDVDDDECAGSLRPEKPQHKSSKRAR